MPKQVEYRGLCLTCNNAASCTLSRDPDRPVMQCEEFESYQPPPPKPVEEQISLLDTADSGEALGKGIDSDKFIGLCKTCYQRSSCKFTKPEGGVWHCEEYR